jgi:8-oxo-dGTP pyrophosphatase MutT (NUDIX family)
MRRDAVRALVIDERDRVLLVRFDSGVWAAPGGGIEPGESDADAVARELREELGLDEAALGPCVWHREHAFDMGAYCGQRERIYLVRTPAFTPRPRVDLAAEHVVELRWWTREELAATTETLVPRRFAALFADLLDGGPGAASIDAGI